MSNVDMFAQLDRIENMLITLTTKRKPVARTYKPEIYSDKFEAIWKDYPTVSGANKKTAWMAYRRRLKTTDKPLQLEVNIHMAVIKYAEFCKATGTFVKLPQTFFGPAEHYLSDWTIPKDPKKPERKEHISSTYKLYDPEADTTSHLDDTNPYGDM